MRRFGRALLARWFGRRLARWFERRLVVSGIGQTTNRLGSLDVDGLDNLDFARLVLDLD